ncbi:MAG: tryptophan--tRNA ligase [Candidatus Micrarchaeota archaeon]|nr:tryptophan--tRNA ligase [Candidatus Micrarchaeota archaeon]
MAEAYHVDAYKVEGKVDYEKFAKQYGIKLIDEALEKRITKHTKTLHFLLRRKIFYAHRELDWILNEYEKGNPFYIYTGRAPSGPMSIGHLLPFELVRWLQEKFDVDVYIQIPDEEKYLAKKSLNMTLEQIHDISYDNVLDIIALGFKPEKTKIFFDTQYAGKMYKEAVKVARHITFSTVKDAFGFTNESNIGQIFYTSMQAVPAFLKSVEEGRNVPCLIPLAIDQDVHFRVARDVIGKLGYYKPAIMHTKFMPGLNGESKMSSSEENTAIYLKDTPEQVKKKINRALTGQQATAELQKELGGDVDKCMICQYYKYFFEPDDKKLAEIFKAEKNGTLLAGEHKARLADTINAFLKKHNQNKERMRDRVDEFILRD